jgi:hypothetical protein
MRRYGRSPFILSVVTAGVLFGSTYGAMGSDARLDVGGIEIKVLSNRADLVSGGDALVAVLLPDASAGAPILKTAVAGLSQLKVSLGARDVTGSFHALTDLIPAMSHRPMVVGMVRGLALGANVLSARLTDGRGATITITNHPIGGPVFGGPQVKPWICTTEDSGLGKAQDAQCNAPTTFEFLYKSTDPTASGLQPYDPKAPPSDVATTTTDEGATVPFIVRTERGTIDRAIYDIAILYDPTKPWTPEAAQAGWNHKVTVPFGGSCGPWHLQSVGPAVLDEMALGRGFAVATSGLNTLGNNCNEVVSAEALMMVKEHLIETYGPIRFTIGTGCSGGSIQQQNIAATYPGLLDGIIPSCSFPDVWTTATEVFECRLLLHYFNETSPELWAVAQQRSFVSGHQSPTLCSTWVNVYGFDREGGDPTIGCTVPLLSTVDLPFVGTVSRPDSAGEPDWVYDPETNPKGVRCTIQDYSVATFGRRSKDGFAKRPGDNVGIQYGLSALQSGEILPEQFVDLNTKIGGLDIDLKYNPERTTADPGAVEIAYRTGRVSNGRELAKVPIIDLRGNNNNEIHANYHSYSTKERLLAANGTAANQAIFISGAPLVPLPSVAQEAFDLMDEWLAAIEKDTSADPIEAKVLKNKPAGAVDSCYVGEQKVTDQTTCSALYPHYTAPRIVAGGPLSDDVLKCSLKPLRREDYNVTFTDDEWASLSAAFPTGVCDWNRRGVGQQASIPWMTFSDGPGGRPLGPAPASSPIGVLTARFDVAVLGARSEASVPAGEKLPATGVASGAGALALGTILIAAAAGIGGSLRRSGTRN